MSFDFSLGAVLRVREIAEQREERLLTQILSEIAKVANELDELGAQVQALLSRSQSELAISIRGAQLQTSYAHLRALEVMQKEVAEQLAKLEMLRDQQMRVYAAAHRNREVLSELRLGQLADFDYLRARKEQAMMDDNFAARSAK